MSANLIEKDTKHKNDKPNTAITSITHQSAIKLSNNLDFLICHVCAGEPKKEGFSTLPCGHPLCMNCIETQSNHYQKETLPCPLCNQPYKTRAQRPNLALNNLIQNINEGSNTGSMLKNLSTLETRLEHLKKAMAEQRKTHEHEARIEGHKIETKLKEEIQQQTILNEIKIKQRDELKVKLRQKAATIDRLKKEKKKWDAKNKKHKPSPKSNIEQELQSIKEINEKHKALAKKLLEKNKGSTLTPERSFDIKNEPEPTLFSANSNLNPVPLSKEQQATFCKQLDAKIAEEYEQVLKETSPPTQFIRSLSAQEKAKQKIAEGKVRRSYLFKMRDEFENANNEALERFRSAFEHLKSTQRVFKMEDLELRFGFWNQDLGRSHEHCYNILDCFLRIIHNKALFFTYGDKTHDINTSQNISRYLASPLWRVHKQMLEILIEGGLQKELIHLVDEASSAVYNSSQPWDQTVPQAVMDFIKRPRGTITQNTIAHAAATATTPSTSLATTASTSLPFRIGESSIPSNSTLKFTL